MKSEDIALAFLQRAAANSRIDKAIPTHLVQRVAKAQGFRNISQCYDFDLSYDPSDRRVRASWVEYYDGDSNDYSVNFPIELVDLEGEALDNALSVMKTEHEAQRKAEEEKQVRLHREQNEARERALYESLRQKFEQVIP